MFILYAEDDIDDFYLFSETLRTIDPDVQVINTRDGFETLQYLENERELPDVIFLDINMPSMDGKSCLKEIRRDERYKSVPVVIYTTSRNPLDKEHCLELGASDFIQKPTNVLDATEQLSRYIKTAL